MLSDNAIHVSVTIDESYFQHTAVMLCSLFENNPTRYFVIYLLTDAQNKKELNVLTGMVKKYGHGIKTIAVDQSKIEGVKVDGHISKATYYRLVMPQYVQHHTSKILYLDSDIIIKTDVGELWDTDMKNFPIAAVPEIVCEKNAKPSVFNAGVLLININCWIAENITEKALSFARNNHDLIVHWDQDVLNAIFCDNWMLLPQRWNVISSAFVENKILPIEEIGVIHYTGSLKPWNYHCQHPLQSEYFRYLKKTPWKNFHFKEDTFWHRVKQSSKTFANKIVGKKIFKVYA